MAERNGDGWRWGIYHVISLLRLPCFLPRQGGKGGVCKLVLFCAVHCSDSVIPREKLVSVFLPLFS